MKSEERLIRWKASSFLTWKLWSYKTQTCTIWPKIDTVEKELLLSSLLDHCSLPVLFLKYTFKDYVWNQNFFRSRNAICICPVFVLCSLFSSSVSRLFKNTTCWSPFLCQFFFYSLEGAQNLFWEKDVMSEYKLSCTKPSMSHQNISKLSLNPGTIATIWLGTYTGT